MENCSLKVTANQATWETYSAFHIHGHASCILHDKLMVERFVHCDKTVFILLILPFR